MQPWGLTPVGDGRVSGREACSRVTQKYRNQTRPASSGLPL